MNLVVTLSGNDTQEFKTCLEQGAAEILGTRTGIAEVSRAVVSTLLNDGDYINAYHNLIVRELHQRNIDERNVTIEWDLEG